MSADMLVSRAVACLSGAAVGDALGGATEGWESREIHDHYGGWVEGIVESMRHRLGVVKPFSPFWKGSGHVTDDTLMTRVLVTAYAAKRDHLGAHDLEELVVPLIVDEATWIPELDREDLLYHRLFLAEKWLVLKLRYGHADPRDAGVGNIVNCGAAMYIAPVGIANSGDPDGAYLEALDLTSGHQSSYGREAAGVLAAAVAEAMRPGATPDSVVATAIRLAKDGTRTAIEAVAEAAAGLDGWRDGGLGVLREAIAPFDSVGEAYARPAPERPHPEPDPRDRGGSGRARPAGRDRRRLHRDDARGRELRPRLRLDCLDGRRPRGRAGLAGAGRARRGGRGRESARPRGARPQDGRGGRGDPGPRPRALRGSVQGDGRAIRESLFEDQLDPAGGPGRSRAETGG